MFPRPSDNPSPREPGFVEASSVRMRPGGRSGAYRSGAPARAASRQCSESDIAGSHGVRSLARPSASGDNSPVARDSAGGAEMRMVHGLAMLALFVALTAGAAAQTQITTASIGVIAIDAGGGVLPGVDVEVRNTATNVTRMLQTDRDGRFAALQLQPGRYRVMFTLSGFATL